MIKSPKLLGLGPYFSRGFVWNEVTRAPSLLFPQPSKELWLAFPGSPLMQRGLTAGSSPTHPSLTHPPSEWSLLCIHQSAHLWSHLPCLWLRLSPPILPGPSLPHSCHVSCSAHTLSNACSLQDTWCYFSLLWVSRALGCQFLLYLVILFISQSQVSLTLFLH